MNQLGFGSWRLGVLVSHYKGGATVAAKEELGRLIHRGGGTVGTRPRLCPKGGTNSLPPRDEGLGEDMNTGTA